MIERALADTCLPADFRGARGVIASGGETRRRSLQDAFVSFFRARLDRHFLESIKPTGRFYFQSIWLEQNERFVSKSFVC